MGSTRRSMELSPGDWRWFCHQNGNAGADGMARTDMTMISSENVRGTEVFGPNGDAIGQIEHLMIDKPSGRVTYAVISFGGFLGMGHSQYPLPWGALNYDSELGGFRTNVTAAQLKTAPEFNDNSWTDQKWEAQTHDNYGMPGYWMR
jgi:sporulation protein YlmC with PRC-barrel domain